MEWRANSTTWKQGDARRENNIIIKKKVEKDKREREGERDD